MPSPLHAVLTSGARLRQRLCAAEGVERFTFLADLSRSGCTDYIAVPLPTRRPTAHVLSLATRRPDWWQDADLDAFDRLLSAFAMLVEVWECERLLETAATDALTKVASRRAFEAPLRHGWSAYARTVAERVRAAVIALGIPHAPSWVAPHVTVSVGTATVVPDIHSERTRLLELADAALYRAKAAGRNRIESA